MYMSEAKEIKFVYLCFFFLLLYFILVFKTDFRGPDMPVYYAYTESIIEDGDLNLINNVRFRSKDDYRGLKGIGISRTYNYPNFHNHGGVILWAPFYIYGNFIHTLTGRGGLSTLYSLNPEKFRQAAMSLSTVVFGFLVLILTYKLCTIFFSAYLSLFATLVVCFGTPFFYFLLFEPGNAQIIASFFSVVSLWAISCIMHIYKKWHWFIYGLFFGICIVVKIDLLFQIVFIAFIFLAFLVIKRIKLIHGIFFFSGILPAYLLKTINDYIKYGTFHIGEAGVLNLENSYFFEMLFSSYRGYLYTSPILYISLSGFIMAVLSYLKKIQKTGAKGSFNIFQRLENYRKKDFFALALGFYLVVKTVIISYNYAWGGGTPGARILLTEFPVFVILYAYVFQTKKIFLRNIIIFVSLIFVAWNLFIISEYVAGVDLGYVFWRPPITQRLKSLQEIFVLLTETKDLSLKFAIGFLPLLVILIIGFYLLKAKRGIFSIFEGTGNNKAVAFKLFLLFTMFLNISYGYVTWLNLANNRKNVERLKDEGFFEGWRVLPPEKFEKRENIGAMNEMIEYFTLRGDYERVERIERQKERMYGRE